jgi:NitT/TauT family transport system ATP-binding protein
MKMTDSPYIEVKNLSKTYGDGRSGVCALEDVSFIVNEGEFVVLVGPSGCGKTTILKVLTGLIPQTSGSVIVGGNEVKGPQPDIGIVFQIPALLPWRKVVGNVMLPIEVLKLKQKEYSEKAHDLIKLTGLKGFENNYPWELSGGMQQRVSICRALIHDPKLLIMDEPFGALDAFTREQMNLELLRIWSETKKTILLVTHNILESVFLADRVVVLSQRPSRVTETVEVRIRRPRDLEMQTTDEFGNYVVTIRQAIDRSIRKQP